MKEEIYKSALEKAKELLDEQFQTKYDPIPAPIIEAYELIEDVLHNN